MSMELVNRTPDLQIVVNGLIKKNGGVGTVRKAIRIVKDAVQRLGDEYLQSTLHIVFQRHVLALARKLKLPDIDAQGLEEMSFEGLRSKLRTFIEGLSRCKANPLKEALRRLNEGYIRRFLAPSATPTKGLRLNFVGRPRPCYH